MKKLYFAHLIQASDLPSKLEKHSAFYKDAFYIKASIPANEQSTDSRLPIYYEVLGEGFVLYEGTPPVNVDKSTSITILAYNAHKAQNDSEDNYAASLQDKLGEISKQLRNSDSLSKEDEIIKRVCDLEIIIDGKGIALKSSNAYEVKLASILAVAMAYKIKAVEYCQKMNDKNPLAIFEILKKVKEFNSKYYFANPINPQRNQAYKLWPLIANTYDVGEYHAKMLENANITNSNTSLIVTALALIVAALTLIEALLS